MSDVSLFLIAVGLSMDAFAVAIAVAVGLEALSRRRTFRLAFHFGLFQAAMPVLGWLAGQSVSGLIARWDHWVAFALLVLIGANGIRESWRGGARRFHRSDPTRGLMLLALCVATSIDALAVGLSFAMLRVSIWYPSVVIGVVCSALTVCGMLLGRQLGVRFGRRVEAVGGLILIGIGIEILVKHVT